MMELCGLPQMANPPSVWTYPSDCKGGPFTGTTPNLLGTYPRLDLPVRLLQVAVPLHPPSGLTRPSGLTCPKTSGLTSPNATVWTYPSRRTTL